MIKLSDEKCDATQLSPLALAFMGDTVYDLLVREMLITEANRPAKKLHECAVKRVRASAQAAAYEKIIPLLSPEEEAVLRRGRNAHVNHIPKNGNCKDYHYATALETLFGYLYLSGREDRLRELFSQIIEAEGEDERYDLTAR